MSFNSFANRPKILLSYFLYWSILGNQLKHSSELTSQCKAYLQCLKCGADSLRKSVENLSITCDKCEANYPLISFGSVQIPFLFEDVDTAMQGWCARHNGFMQKIDQEIKELALHVNDKKSSKLTRERIKNILTAKKEYRNQISKHLEFIDQHSVQQTSVYNSAIAKNQGIDSYVNNIFRDWSWENGENTELLNTVLEVLPSKDYQAGQTLTLGAGASRLSYDFHYACHSEHSVLLDINPMLLGVGAKVIDGNSFSLYEFPVAPISKHNFAVNKQCDSPANEKHCSENFEYIIADALNAPFTQKSFDTILTPWLIDIIPMDLREFIPHVNRFLKSGGRWINSGSLAFFHCNEQWNYSEEEVVDLLKKYGFDEIRVKRTNINYLNSPDSAHGRIENVFSFSARKKFDTQPPKNYNYLPHWISDADINIPLQDELLVKSSKFLLQAQVLSAIDGKRSMYDIGRLVAKQYGMSEESACAAVRQILIENNRD